MAAPALVLVGYALVAFLLPTTSRVEWFVNGDHVRHLVLVADERARGALSYEIRPYPRGWHTSVALLWSALGGPGNPPQLAGLINLMSTCAWLLSAALALATATLGAAVATRVGTRSLAAGVAGAVAASVTLWPTFLGDYQALGLESSLVAAVVLAVCLRELLERLGSLSAFLVCASGLVVMGHTWQLLLPVSGIAVVVAGWVYARGGPPRRWVVVLGGLAVAGLSILPAFRRSRPRSGSATPSSRTSRCPCPWRSPWLGVVASLALAWWRRRDLVLVGVLLLVCLPALTGVVLALRLGISATTYYPGKLLWHTAALGLTTVAAVLALAWQRLGARPSLGASLGRAAIGATAVLCALVGVVVALRRLPRHLVHGRRRDRAEPRRDPRSRAGAGGLDRRAPRHRRRDPHPARRLPPRGRPGRHSAGADDGRSGVRAARRRRASRHPHDDARGAGAHPLLVRAERRDHQALTRNSTHWPDCSTSGYVSAKAAWPGPSARTSA